METMQLVEKLKKGAVDQCRERILAHKEKIGKQVVKDCGILVNLKSRYGL